MVESHTDLPDYKWYCFDGEPKYCQVIQNRSSNETIDFFDTEWNHQEFVGLNPAAVAAAVAPSRPKNLEKQIDIARMLSKNIPFSRIDLYEIKDNTYFGEITLFPLSGMGRFNPVDYDEILGRMINLSGVAGGGYLVDNNRADLLDYKVFCFNGVPKMIEVDYNRFVNHKRNLYTPNWQLIEASIGYPSEEGSTFERPLLLEEMLDTASKLSKGIPHVRVDFYITNNRLLFGELTFYHGSGMEKTGPKEFDHILGNLIKLPKNEDTIHS